MAKFAANLTMLFTEVPFLARFEQARQAGFQAVEYLFPYDYEADQLAEQLQFHQLEQALFNMPPGDWAGGERGIAALPDRVVEFEQSVETALHYAQALQCKKVHAMAGIVNPAFSLEAHRETFIRNLRYAADRFAAHGISVMIEPLNSRDVPEYFVAHQRDAVTLIQAIDRPNVKLQFDAYHAQIMDGDLTVLIQDLADHIGHVQIASVPARHEPFGGEINYPYLFEVLDKSGYQGWIGCEYNPQQGTQEGLSWVTPYL
ncbi:hydroxypyruvate isomerase family protein (plasmid) [Photobacterium sp. GJ3]|uniref:2-oxo-tetronate isomerase n=1 Tax=Photobacterium sp. GJ3 TaxID=2829502 RepID=UPI001B8CADBA|nr:2-oxo-tetronate isomerase [Photobacterium sp. GJ3]QUJ69568.1 hydroxypyruvate isomerase family protein [Photobacterium sp. GJ3]